MPLISADPTSLSQVTPLVVAVVVRGAAELRSRPHIPLAPSPPDFHSGQPPGTQAGWVLGPDEQVLLLPGPHRGPSRCTQAGGRRQAGPEKQIWQLGACLFLTSRAIL